MKNSYYQMPQITIPDGLDDHDRKLVEAIISSKTGLLRASAPTLARKIEIPNPDKSSIFTTTFVYANPEDAFKGEAYYVWRMVAFFVSPHPEHQCTPVTAEMYLDGCGAAEHRDQAKILDILVDKITNLIPKDQWHGVSRWAKALGY